MSNEQAVNSYNQPRNRGGNPRETEGRALLEAARRMAEAQNTPEDSEAMRGAARVNWRLWTIFQGELSTPDSPVPVEIRQNMLNLCNFVDKRVVEILAEPKPELFNVLINVNRQIAAGLMSKPETAPAEDDDQGPQEPAAPGGSSDLSI